MRLVKALLFLAFVVSLTACSVSKRVERRSGYLLTRNTVKTDRQGISQSDLLNFAQPKPNRKFLGLFRTRIAIWDAFSDGNSRFNKWMVRNFGEPPVILDTVMAYNSLAPMRQYLANKGYFGSDVTYKALIKRSKARVYFTTSTPLPFKFGSITYDIKDDTIKKLVLSDHSNSLIKEGNQYDAYKLSDERDRITQLLKNSGYYAFTSDYVFFEVDTIGTNKIAHLSVIISNRENRSEDKIASGDTPEETLAHRRYIINNIFIHSDFPKATDTVKASDTLAWYGKVPTANDSIQPPLFYELYRNRVRLRPDALSKAVFVKPGEFYSQKNVNLTYNRIRNLGLSNYVSINVRPPVDTAVEVQEDFELLDFEVRMVRAEVNGFSIESEGTNAGGLLGIGGSLNFRNSNIFRGAENFRVKAYGGFEIAPSISGGEDRTHFGIFNSLETGLETGLDFPRLLSPFVINGLDQNSRPRTSIGLGFNYELRSQFERYLAKLSLSYEWNASPVSRHIFTPVDLSSISIVRDSAFTARLLAMDDPRYLSQYSNHLILAMKYSYIFNNQNLTDRKNFTYFRINLEPAGNLFNLVSNVTAAPRDEDDKFTLFGLRYAQYFRTDWDFRYYKAVTQHQRAVYRLALGIGIPYGNSIALPFEKGFFAGGANGMRGWPVRSLGPGEYSSENARTLEKVGDLWLEANVEYRFPIYSFLNGAFFADAGNIWLLEENIDFPGGKFEWKNALKTLAFDAGFGIRFDFSLFIFRIDGGLPIYDPGKASDDRFFMPTKFQLNDINWNFGIGYPF